MRSRRLALLWSGAAALALLGIAPARADEKADALLKEVEAASRAAQTLTADISLSQSSPGREMMSSGTVKLKKPNFALVEIKGKTLGQVIASDGKTVWTFMPQQNQYMKAAVDSEGKNINALWAFPVGLFFHPGLIEMFGESGKVKPTLAAPETVDGIEYQALEYALKEPVPQTIRFYVSPDKIITRFHAEIKQEGATQKYDATLSNVKLNADIPDADFAYTPPKTAKAYEPPSYEGKLVAVGKPAPKFNLTTPTGKPISLARALKGKKALVVNFWFYG